ncbi:alpha-amylase family protein [Vibrio sp. SCSIO 43137]|uniref:alpha-amylase family protein n=1 Tax=Vibrio sp. SCSIO 43137 TaxID=3021011 RepID=UPI002307FEA4|nr:alpha-amylase family protein [Vibrio sp. SCSIO 43137]WCE31810.1 beta-galactosidase trimerization domain-containing protein [Vibrio sp. SCSIO 43137]
MEDIAFRQVHLDFHTSQHIPDVGGSFDKQQFADMFVDACVNSVTCFARCHHGYMYYPSKCNSERIHPNLVNKNLLVEQVQSLRDRGIRVPIYTTVQWDEYISMHNPEWHVVGEQGEMTEGLYEPTFRRALCVNTPYRGWLKEHISELFGTFPVTGLFLDIVKVIDCSCRWCRADMKAQGLNPSEKDDRMVFAIEMMKGFKKEISAHIRGFNPHCEIFYNQGHIAPDTRDSIEHYSHLEVESLPTGEWGYGHFPAVVRYARTLGYDFIGMTGKFHTSWGDMHSFKNQAALEFEVFHMLAMNGKCSIGDQLHPDGQPSKATYDLVGEVYRQVKDVEPWCVAAKAKTDIGVLNPEEFTLTVEFWDQAKVLHGVTRILVEGGHQFDIIDSRADFEQYKLLILPDEVPVDEVLDKRLRSYCEQGGKVLATYKSGLKPEEASFSSDLFGVSYIGDAPFSPDYLLPGESIGKDLPKTEHVMYLKGLEVLPLPTSKVLCNVVKPYFNRTWQHFCSHMHTPSSGQVGYPGVVQSSSGIYFCHPVFNQFVKNAPIWVKKMVLDAIDMLLPEPLLRHNGPGSLITALNAQQIKNRDVLHLLHYIPERKSDETLIVEDVIPIYKVDFSIKYDVDVKSIKLVPQDIEVEFKKISDRVYFLVEKIIGHQMIEIQY